MLRVASLYHYTSLARPVLNRAHLSINRSRALSSSSDVNINARDSAKNNLQGGPLHNYNNLVAAKKLRDDPHQRIALAHLQNLYSQLQGYSPVKHEVEAPSLFSKMFSFGNKSEATSRSRPKVVDSEKVPKGIYMFGDVGCGKSFLMDTFYNSCAMTNRKKRVHFHHFMMDVHARIHKWRVHKKKDDIDPLPKLARDLVNDAWLLCFDEFQVTDVADAMILERLFSYMIDVYGAVLVATSNREPDELYKNGLQRDRFIPFIDLLKMRCRIHNLNSGVDYRLTGSKTTQVYYTPNNAASTAALKGLFAKLSHNETPRPETLTVLGRRIDVPVAARGVAYFHFSELCDRALGASDYIALCTKFHTVIVEGIPKMNENSKNQARRFITLVDVLYEHKVKLVCSADGSPPQLFSLTQDGSGHIVPVRGESGTDDGLGLDSSTHRLFSGEEEAFAFARAASRLVEMQNDLYLSAAHQPPPVTDE